MFDDDEVSSAQGPIALTLSDANGDDCARCNGDDVSSAKSILSMIRSF